MTIKQKQRRKKEPVLFNYYITNKNGNVLRVVNNVTQQVAKAQIKTGEILHKGDIPNDATLGQTDNSEITRELLIKKKAGKAIINKVPEWKQANLTARALELTEKLATGQTLTAEERVELNAIKQTWAEIKAIRESSNQAEKDGTLVDDYNP